MTETAATYAVEGLVINIPIEAWAQGFKERAERMRRDLWDLIDHLADGYQMYGDLIFQYIDEPDFSLPYLRNLLTTGTNFPESRRANLPALSVSHFQTVNSLEPGQQDEWLWWAYEKNLSRDELRAELRRRGLVRSRDFVDVVLENDALIADNERLKRENGRQRDELRATRARIEAEAADECQDDPADVADRAYWRDTDEDLPAQLVADLWHAAALVEAYEPELADRLREYAREAERIWEL